MGHNRPEITPERINQIQQLIKDSPGLTRTAISKKLCEMWDWISPVGQPKDISARDLLRALDRKGKIELPAARWTPRAPGVGADKIALVDHEDAPIEAKLADIGAVQIKIAASKSDAALFKSFIEQYHYLGYDRSIGENMKYFVLSGSGAILSCAMFGSAAWSCRPRDEYIGWRKTQRMAGLAYIAGNNRFLIMPWVRVPHLASHVLGAIARRVSADWVSKYGHPLYAIETFVETERFAGTCYKAANWRHVGYTSGLGRNSRAASPALPVKSVMMLPLCKGFKEKLRNARGA